MAQPATVDAVVVGAGPNGLSAALTLARAGRSVIVFERNETIGGGARTSELTLTGFHHDICSAIHPLTAASPFLSTLPLNEHGLEWVSPPAALAHPLDDGTAVMLEQSIEATTESLKHSADATSYRQLVEAPARRWDDLAGILLAPPRLPRHPLLLARFGISASRSGSGLARSRFQGERARALFAGLAAHSMLPLEQMPSAAFGMVLSIAAHVVNWPFPRGGAQGIPDAMASLLRDLGGAIVTGRAIESLSELPPARAYLFDTSPRQLISIARDELPASYVRRLKKYRYGPGAFKIDWALDGPIPWMAEECRRAGTVHLGGTLEEVAASERAPWRNEHSERPFVLLAQQSLFDETRAPEGRQVAWGYCHVPHASTADMTEHIEAQVERFAPGFRDRILARHTMNTAQLQQHNPNCIGGDISGGVSDVRQLIARPVLRLTPYATPNPKLFLCSASTPPGGGVHGMCGYHAAQAVLRRRFR